MKLGDLNLHSIGNEIQLTGAIYSGEGKHFLCFFPDERSTAPRREIEVLDMDYDDWVKFIRQTDLLETEIIAKSGNGEMVKAVIRKSQRQIDQSVSWRVFHRDSYRCRYCGRGAGTPLTVDHAILWESGGPSTEENLVTACKKCNRTRGNTLYEHWLASDYYARVSAGISANGRELNSALIPRLASIPRVVHKRSR